MPSLFKRPAALQAEILPVARKESAVGLHDAAPAAAAAAAAV